MVLRLGLRVSLFSFIDRLERMRSLILLFCEVWWRVLIGSVCRDFRIGLGRLVFLSRWWLSLSGVRLKM